MPVIISPNEIALIGVVGAGLDEGFDSTAVIQALAVVGRETPLTVRVNSGGGIATEGAAIHAALKNHKGRVHVVIEGIAASAASLVALGGSTVSARQGAVFMIHDPAGLTFGNAAEHRKTIEALDTLADAYASIYADKTHKSAKAMRELMKAETWYTAAEAVAAGFVNKVDTGANDNKPAEAAAFDYRVYARAPQQLVAQAQAYGWQRPGFGLGPRPQTAATQPTPRALPTDPAVRRANEWAAAIVMMCCDAGVPDLAASFIRERTSLDDVRARIEGQAGWGRVISRFNNN